MTFSRALAASLVALATIPSADGAPDEPPRSERARAFRADTVVVRAGELPRPKFRPVTIASEGDQSAPLDWVDPWLAADLDGDGAHDVLVLEQRRGELGDVVARSRHGGAEIWRMSLSGEFARIAIGDLDDREGWEMLVIEYAVEIEEVLPGIVDYTVTSTLSLHDARIGGTERWRRVFRTSARGPYVADLFFVGSFDDYPVQPMFTTDASGDGVGDLFVGSWDLTDYGVAYSLRDPIWRTIDIVDGETIASFAPANSHDWSFPIGDVSGDALADVLVPSTSEAGRVLRAVSTDGATTHWEIPFERFRYAYWAEPRTRGTTDVVVVSSAIAGGEIMTLLRGSDGSALWSMPLDYRRLYFFDSDVDRDGGMDIYDLPWQDDEARVSVFSGARGERLWTSSVPNREGSVTWAHAGWDADGDGILDVTISDEWSDSITDEFTSRIIAFSGAGTGPLWIVEDAGWFDTSPLNADYDGDGGLDIAVPRFTETSWWIEVVRGADNTLLWRTPSESRAQLWSGVVGGDMADGPGPEIAYSARRSGAIQLRVRSAAGNGWTLTLE